MAEPRIAVCLVHRTSLSSIAEMRRDVLPLHLDGGSDREAGRLGRSHSYRKDVRRVDVEQVELPFPRLLVQWAAEGDADVVGAWKRRRWFRKARPPDLFPALSRSFPSAPRDSRTPPGAVPPAGDAARSLRTGRKTGQRFVVNCAEILGFSLPAETPRRGLVRETARRSTRTGRLQRYVGASGP